MEINTSVMGITEFLSNFQRFCLSSLDLEANPSLYATNTQDVQVPSFLLDGLCMSNYCYTVGYLWVMGFERKV